MSHKSSVELTLIHNPDQISVNAIPDRRINERKLYNIYFIWLILSLLYLIGVEILGLWPSFYQICENDSKFFIQTDDMNTLFLLAATMHIVASIRIWLWYDKIGIVGIPVEFALFYIIDAILAFIGLMSYLNILSVCPDGNSWLLIPMISYNFINVILFLYFNAFPWVNKRMVCNRDQLYLTQSLLS